jgi:hypothetical protein
MKRRINMPIKITASTIMMTLLASKKEKAAFYPTG